MLDSWRVLVLAGNAAALIAGLSTWNSLTQRVLFTAVLLLWPALCWYGMRVAIDASLFRAMAKSPEESALVLDAFLITQGLAKKPKARPIDERCGAALRLWRMLMFLAATQVLCAILGAWSAGFERASR